MRDEEKKFQDKLKLEIEKWDNTNNKRMIKLSRKDVENVVSQWTGIPMQNIGKEDNENYLLLEESLKKKVIGQDEAIDVVSKAIKRGRVGLKDPKRPIGSFLFLGPTGVGKTKLAKVICEEIFGSEDSMIRLDMSEFMEPHSVSKIIGAPPRICRI